MLTMGSKSTPQALSFSFIAKASPKRLSPAKTIEYLEGYLVGLVNFMAEECKTNWRGDRYADRNKVYKEILRVKKRIDNTKYHIAMAWGGRSIYASGLECFILD